MKDLNNKKTLIEIEEEMTKNRQEKYLLIFGAILSILGGFLLFLHYIVEINLIFGNILIDTSSTGIFVGVLGIFSLILYKLLK